MHFFMLFNKIVLVSRFSFLNTIINFNFSYMDLSSRAMPVLDHFYKMVKARGARSVGPGAPPPRDGDVTWAPPPVTCQGWGPHLSLVTWAPVAHLGEGVAWSPAGGLEPPVTCQNRLGEGHPHPNPQPPTPKP